MKTPKQPKPVKKAAVTKETDKQKYMKKPYRKGDPVNR